MMRGTVLVAALALVAAGCTNNNSTTPTTPSIPTTTDTKSGTVQVKGSDFQTFTVTTTGQVDVTLTAAGPPATIVMGLGVGQSGPGSCGLLPGASTQTAAGSSPQVSGIMTPATYCVMVYDVGNMTAPINYTVTVTHP
ncbi:MAG TPA: hypothetical protein VIW45_08610 [Vicinamibacterales bacterium]|jgi:hypothetical protein